MTKPNSSAILDWVKALIPYILAILGLWFALGNRDARLLVVENKYAALEARFEVMADDIVELKENTNGLDVMINLVYDDVQWLRNNWRGQ